jgi:HK97 family phage major capsid protein
MTQDIRNALYDMGRAFEQYKETNDKILREIATKGAADPLTENKLSRLNEEMNRASDLAMQSKRRLDQMEVAMKRAPLSAMGGDDFAEAGAFTAERKSHLQSDLSVDQYRLYKSALKNYLRKNNAGFGVEEIKALSVGSDPDGGYAVTPDLSGRITQMVYDGSPMRQVANVVTIGTDALEGLNDLDDLSAGWVGETEARTETSTPKMGEWRIPVHELYAEPRATQKLLDDALFSVEDYLAGKIADKLTRMENDAFVNGNGVRKPRGFLTYGEGVPSASNWQVIERVNTGANGAFASTNKGDALINLVYALKAGYRDQAVFMMKRSVLAEVRKLKDDNNNYLWQPDFQSAEGGNLLGFRVLENENMPEIAAGASAIAFGNFNKGYQIVDRQGIRILRDAFTAKPYVKFYTTKRTGGDVVNFEAIKILKFSA